MKKLVWRVEYHNENSMDNKVYGWKHSVCAVEVFGKYVLET
jgi:hypothetical protein